MINTDVFFGEIDLNLDYFENKVDCVCPNPYIILKRHHI